MESLQPLTLVDHFKPVTKDMFYGVGVLPKFCDISSGLTLVKSVTLWLVKLVTRLVTDDTSTEAAATNYLAGFARICKQADACFVKFQIGGIKTFHIHL